MSLIPHHNHHEEAYAKQEPSPPRTGCVHAHFDFEVHGGAVGEVIIALDAPIPTDAIMFECLLSVETPFTSGGAATVAFGVVGAGDLIAAQSAVASPWSVAGNSEEDLVAALVKTGMQYSHIRMDIAAYALTAGKATLRFVYA
jgi:hypothetical protein